MTEFIRDQTVFFVDDDPGVRDAHAQTLELAGLSVRTFEEATAPLAELTPAFAGIVVSDIRMPGIDGLELFARVREIDAEIPVILITGHADVPEAVSALRNGAFDFLAKPFAADHFVASVSKALANRALILDNRALRAAARVEDSPLIGDSPAITQLRDNIVQIARAGIDVLIEGETGTGKELVAAMLHRQSARRMHPFVAVNCAALPEASAELELFGHVADAVPNARFDRTGRIERASRGTLFLDEIDGMPFALQSRLLRVLEEREVLPVGAERPVPLDLRVIAASKRDLGELVARGLFRDDLYFRLNVVRLHIPPLRNRRSDIPQLFAHFVSEATAQLGKDEFTLRPAVRARLLSHDWPGNVRELRNFAFRAVMDLQAGDGGADEEAKGLQAQLADYERLLIVEALQACSGNVAEAAALLRLPRKTLYDKIARLGIDVRARRR